MSTDRDTTRIVRSWLRTDEHESADQLLDNVLGLLDTTPQRRAWWPARRIADMNTYTKIAIAAAAVVVVAVVGFNLLPGDAPPGGAPVDSPSASPSAPPSPSQSPAFGAWPRGTLEDRRYYVSAPVPFSFAPPSLRWRSTAFEPPFQGIETGIDPGVGVPEDEYAWIVFPDANDIESKTGVVATDACAGEAAPVEGSSIEDLAAALTTIPGTSAEEPVDVTVGGRHAKLVVLRIDPDPPCDIHSFWLYGRPSLYPNKVTSIIRIWITEVDGHRYMIHTDQSAPNAENEREIQQIIDSIEFE